MKAKTSTITKKLQQGEELIEREVYQAVEMLLDEEVSVETKADFLRALTAKGETPSEITYFVEACLERAVDPELGSIELEGPTIDVCGTGGDGLNLFNVSTTAMFVLAAGGAKICKHGNRGVTSKSGGADVLEELGVDLEMSTECFRECIQKTGVGFLFAPKYHPAFRAVVPVRKQLAAEGFRTIFNIVGPLLNPVRPECQLVGICQEELMDDYAEILQRLGRDSAWVVVGKSSKGQPVDEMSVMGNTRICKSGRYQDLGDEVVEGRDFGLKTWNEDDLRGGDAVENAKILRGVLSGEIQGAKREMVLLNAAAGFACAGLSDHLLDGVEKAAQLIDTGAALDKLEAYLSVAAK